ncbi:cardiolipin synthase (CMP-forming) [Entomortierella parvispora]|uniref:Cardiolipin synthase (CMP-forming) n=1 Tax=Entomortierella parvispora TaxID=205924 RepID=A0A9P3LYT2_9FUNG|nr:cardiolipin synthase (CMP-forming) [Entomortierella parvispora]
MTFCRAPWAIVHSLHRSLPLNVCLRRSAFATTIAAPCQSRAGIHTSRSLTAFLLSSPFQHSLQSSRRMPAVTGKSWIRVVGSSFSSMSNHSASSSPMPPSPDQDEGKGIKKSLLHENIYTIPNFLTVSRLIAAPVIGYWVLKGDYTNACILFGVASITDGLDGWIARRFNMQSIVGTILDPMADKTLMTILTVTLAMQELIPIPIATIILGRDAGLILASFYYRYISLPEPKTFKRYWDFSIPSAEVRPTMISKVNTAIQMGYICLSLMAPVFDFTGHVGLEYLGYTCAATTIWSGASYIYTKDAVRLLHPPKKGV